MNGLMLCDDADARAAPSDEGEDEREVGGMDAGDDKEAAAAASVSGCSEGEDGADEDEDDAGESGAASRRDAAAEEDEDLRLDLDVMQAAPTTAVTGRQPSSGCFTCARVSGASQRGCSGKQQGEEGERSSRAQLCRDDEQRPTTVR